MKLVTGLGYANGEPLLAVYATEGAPLANVHVEDWAVDGGNATLPTIVVECSACKAKVVATQCLGRGRAWCDHGEWT